MSDRLSGPGVVVEGDREKLTKMEDFVVSIIDKDDVPADMIPVGKSIQGCGIVDDDTANELWDYIRSSFDKPYFRDGYHGNAQLFDYVLDGQLRMAVLNNKPIGFVMTSDQLVREKFNPGPIIERRKMGLDMEHGILVSDTSDEEGRDLARSNFLRILEDRFQGLRFKAEVRDNSKFKLKIFRENKKIGGFMVGYDDRIGALQRAESLIAKDAPHTIANILDS